MTLVRISTFCRRQSPFSSINTDRELDDSGRKKDGSSMHGLISYVTSSSTYLAIR